MAGVGGGRVESPELGDGGRGGGGGGSWVLFPCAIPFRPQRRMGARKYCDPSAAHFVVLSHRQSTASASLYGREAPLYQTSAYEGLSVSVQGDQLPGSHQFQPFIVIEESGSPSG